MQPISNEENIILEKIKGHGGPMPKNLLDGREKELARSMVGRGILTRINFENKLCFLANGLDELWEG